MAGFLRPQLLLLAIPVAYALWRTRQTSLITNGLRLLLACSLVLALAEPYLSTTAPGRDLIFVVDRSLSMPTASEKNALELIRLAEEARKKGDRIGVVSFASRAQLERFPGDTSAFGGFNTFVERDASDLHGALETALGLIPEGRDGSLILLSDGDATGQDPLAMARRAFARGVRIDARTFSRGVDVDVSVERLELPDSAAIGEPFQFSAWIEADRATQATLVLERAGKEISRQTRRLRAGMNRILLRDRLDDAGIADYRLRIEGARDRIPENDTGLAAMQVRGSKSILIINDSGHPDVLSRALAGAGIPVITSRPEDARLDPVTLSAHRVVILENVAADRLGTNMSSLRDFVEERGGGLLMTGGQASFGIGGYHLSEVDELLPVSMELRQEHRKMAIAIAIVMDRSGSMSASAGSGQTKMDLANLGSKAVVELLSPMDHLAVIAVDSAPHTIVPLVPVSDKPQLMSRVGSVQSMGGGIFVYDGLAAAKDILAAAPQYNRHVLLFSDAADSEQQQGCETLIQEMRALNMTLSVIALGTEQDVDAPFLKRCAEQGEGGAYFTTNPSELPRLFAQDTLTIARSTFVEEPTNAKTMAALFGMGEIRAKEFPRLPGYNLTYLRPEGIAGIATLDEYRAPVFAHRYHGLGRTAAYTGQVGGSFGDPLVTWEGFAEFFVTLARWLMGQEEPAEVFAEVRREGREAVVSVEIDPEAPTDVDMSELRIRMTSASGNLKEHVLERVDENRFEARTELETGGITLGTVRLGGNRFVELSPITLPYSPEYERPIDIQAGERLMRRLATESGGKLRPTATELFRGDRAGRGWRIFSRELGLAALILMLLEVAGRRLSLWGSLRNLKPRGSAAAKLATSNKKSRQVPLAREHAHDDKSSTTVTSTVPLSGLDDALKRAKRTANQKLSR